MSLTTRIVIGTCLSYFLTMFYAAGVGSMLDHWATQEFLGPLILEEFLVILAVVQPINLILWWRKRNEQD